MYKYVHIYLCSYLHKREKWGKRHMDKDFLFPSYTFLAPGPNAVKTDLLKNGWDKY